MTTAVTHDIILKLVPLITPVTVANTEKADQDSWLNNDNASLIDSLYQTSPVASQTASHNRLHQCEQLSITATPESYQLDTPQGPVSLQEGDIIVLKAIQFLVTLQTQTVAVPEERVALPRRKILPEDDDIWSTRKPRNEQPHFVDPFAYQRPVQITQPVPLALSEKKSPLPNIPMHTPYASPELNDPLGFLYPSAPYQPRETYYSAPHPALMSQPAMGMPTNHYETIAPATIVMPNNSYAAPSTQANVLHDLGINEQQAVMTRREYTAGKATYLEQSPMDMLDEYLRVEEMPMPVQSHYPAAMPTTAPVQMPLSYAPTIHDDEENIGMLSSMKRFFSRKKTETTF